MAPISGATKAVTSGSPAPGTDDTLFGVPKWALAAAAGGLVVAGVMYYVLSSSDSGKKKGAKKKGKKGAGTGAAATTSTPSTANATPTKKTPSKVTIEDAPEEEDDEPTDPAAKALSAKNKGNKYFKGGRYELAIKCYTQAIEVCPQGKSDDLSTFYQNRAAAFEQLENYSSVLSDCTMALKHNPRYVKAMERRARISRKQTEKLTDSTLIIEKLKSALEDMTAVCIMEGFSKQDHMMLVDNIIKELGRAEAKAAFTQRECVLASKHFIKQYLESFEADPIMKASKVFEPENVNELKGLERALYALKTGDYDQVIPACNEEIDGEDANDLTNGFENGHAANTASKHGARLLRATFYILCKKQKDAVTDLNAILEDENAPAQIRSNAFIKRASLHIQLCTDPEKDPLLSFKDFEDALKADPTNPDVYFHRGQVFLLTEQIDKAVEDFNKSVELNPTFPTAYVQKLYTDYRQAMQQNRQEKIKNVMNLFEKAVDKFPDCIETYALFSQVLSDQQNFEKADSYYERAMKVDPNNANILVHRGLIQLQWKGDVAKAIEYLERAISIDEKCEFAYETLGTVEVQRGNLTRSIELFEKAIPLANTELEMAHLFGLMDAAKSQLVVTGKFGFNMAGGPI